VKHSGALHRGVRRPRRPAREGQTSAQAVIETAMILPLLLAMITVFLGLMIEVQVRQQLDSAVALATQSSFQAPARDPTLARYFAAESFEDSMANLNSEPYISYTVGKVNYPYPSPAPPPVDRNPPGPTVRSSLRCNGNWFSNTVPATTAHCEAEIRIKFSKTPLAWALPFWDPLVKSSDDAIPPPLREQP
jgi:hypothetical protein